MSVRGSPPSVDDWGDGRGGGRGRKNLSPGKRVTLIGGTCKSRLLPSGFNQGSPDSTQVADQGA